MELRLYIYIVTVGCLTLEVRSKLTADLVFRQLNDRFDNLAIEMYVLRSELKTMNDRIDNIELFSKSQSEQETDGPRDPGERNDKVDQTNIKQTEERIRKAFISEKTFVRKFLTAYEGKFVKFQKTVSDAISFMNTSIEKTNVNLESKIEEKVQEVYAEFESVVSNASIKLENIGDIRSQSSSINNLDTRISTLENMVRPPSRKRAVQGHVAFQAGVTGDITNIALRQTIVFDNVKLNLGDGYQSQVGLFVAPKAGIYIFSVTILSTTNIEVSIEKNGVQIAGAYAHGDRGDNTSFDQGSVTVVLQLAIGDEVFVENSWPDNTSLRGESHSNFMGCLIMEL